MRLLLSPLRWPALVATWQICAVKEVIEQVFRGNEVLKAMIVASAATPLLPLLVSCLTPNLVVNAALVLVRKTGHRSIHFLKGVCCPRSWVLVRVNFDGPPFKSLFKFCLSAIPLYAEHFVVIFLSNNFSANFSVLFRIGARLCLLCVPLHGFGRRSFLWFRSVARGLSSEVVQSLKKHARLRGFVKLNGFDEKSFGFVEVLFFDALLSNLKALPGLVLIHFIN